MIVPVSTGPFSLTGHALLGERLVRLIFVDESGKSAREPVVVVAAIIVHGDTEWRPIADYLADMVKHYVPAERRKGFFFHARDLFSGNGLGDGVSRDVCLSALEDLISVPSVFSIPVSYGALYKSPSPLDNKPLEREKWAHVLAFMQCLARCDGWVRECCPGEIASIISEILDPTMQELLRETPAFSEEFTHFPSYEGLLPIRAINGTIMFAKKQQEPLLQIVDACSWVARRYLAGYDDVDRFLLKDQSGKIFLKDIRDAKTGGGILTVRGDFNHPTAQGPLTFAGRAQP